MTSNVEPQSVLNYVRDKFGPKVAKIFEQSMKLGVDLFALLEDALVSAYKEDLDLATKLSKRRSGPALREDPEATQRLLQSLTSTT